MKKYRNTILLVIFLLALAAFSFFYLGEKTTSQEFHQTSIASLDSKRSTVLELTSASTATSVALTALPGDLATPIATKLTDVSGYFLIVLCAIYLEKFLLVITGFAAFRILIPLACLMAIIGIIGLREDAIKRAIKMALFALLIFALVPVSIYVTDLIEKTYGNDVSATINLAGEVTADASADIDQVIEEDKTGQAQAGQEQAGQTQTNQMQTNQAQVDQAQSKQAQTNQTQQAIANAEANERKEDSSENSVKQRFNIFHWIGEKIDHSRSLINDRVEDTRSNVIDFVDSATSGINNAAKEKIDKAKLVLNDFIDTLALMIITSCVIPILILVFFGWIIKTFAAVELPNLKKRGEGKKSER